MSLEVERNRFTQAVKSLGLKTLSALYPDEFSYHAVTLELVSSDLNTVESFTFPVVSNSISEDKTSITNIQKSAGGVVIVDNDTFVPTKISMSGTFGRGLRMIISNKPLEFAGVRLQFENKKPGLSISHESPVFSSFAKTGYGCIRILEKLYEKHNQLDDKGRPYLLLLYCPGLGINYVVKINTIIKSENDGTNNMIPKYDLIMTSVAPLEALQKSYNTERLIRNLGKNEIQKGLNGIAVRVKRSLLKLY